MLHQEGWLLKRRGRMWCWRFCSRQVVGLVRGGVAGVVVLQKQEGVGRAGGSTGWVPGACAGAAAMLGDLSDK